MTFNDLALIEPLQRAVSSEGYTHPTPIQQQAIPIVLSGSDLLGCAQTGTGKTAAFALPILQLLHQQSSRNQGQHRPSRHIRSLILTPTRELAIQIQESFETYGKHLPLRCAVIFGGVSAHGQIQSLQRGIDILVATPGRLLDLIGQGHVQLNQLSLFVLDEADRMLDMGFVHDVKRIIALLPRHRQSLFFSATMPPEIVRLADTILTEPAKVEVTPVSSTAETVRQSVYFVEKTNKQALLTDVLQDDAIESVLVFTRTKHGADKVAKALNRSGIKAEAIHGNKSQNARQGALNNFKRRTTRVLVATDIAARGIDVDDLAYVINFEIPNIPETYVHRIGRTGRAGAQGKALSFCDSEERAYLKDIQKLIRQQIPVIDNHPYPSEDGAPLPAPIAVAPSKPAQRPTTEPKSQSRPQARAQGQPATGQSPRPAGQSGSAPKKKRRWYGSKAR